jgi:hypothetical protein
MPDDPTLTELQRLTVQNRFLAYQLAQAQLETVVKELTVPGYLIDLQRLVYVPAGAAVPTAVPRGEGD